MMKISTTVLNFVKKSILIWMFAIAIISTANAQISVSGGNGLASNYASFTSAGGLFEALNATAQTNKNILVTILADVITEDSTNSLNNGDWISIHIKPNGARTISGNVASALFRFTGADSVTVDGLNNGTNSLTIANTSATTSAATILFTNDATNNIIKNCTILGSATAATTGVIYFGTGTTTGNTGNVVKNCNITGNTQSSLPAVCIYSLGTSAAVSNKNITIDNNNIYDYYSATSVTYAINISNTNSNSSAQWTITNNKFYQTDDRYYTTANSHVVIYVVSGDGYNITGNRIGGNNPQGTGQYKMTCNNAIANRLVGIWVNTSTNTNLNTISNDTISNIFISSTNTNNAGNGSLCGIYVLGAAYATISNCLVGSTSEIGSLYVYQRASGGSLCGIGTQSTDTVRISNNYIGGLTNQDSLPTYQTVVFGINYNAAAANLIINNNTIGNSLIDNMVAGTSSSTTASTLVYGIGSQSVSPTILNCYNNVIQNLTSYGTGTTGFVRGISTNNTASITTALSITNNTIKNLNTLAALNGASSGMVSAGGICFRSGLNANISQNTIYNISNSNTTATTGIMTAGIAFGGSKSPSITQNLIYGLSNSGIGTNATTPPCVAGILIYAATTSVKVINNMISLGYGDVSNPAFIGIWASHSGVPVPVDSIFHNTVNIEGNVNSGATPSFGFLRGDLTLSTPKTATIYLYNNIFTVSRNGASTSSYAIANNYGVLTAPTTGWAAGASNFNILNANAATVGYWGGNMDFNAWQNASNGDGNSYSDVSVTYVNSASDLHINMGILANSIESRGTLTDGVTSDYDGQARPGPLGSVNGGGAAPDLGADEFDGALINTCTTPIVNTISASVNPVACSGNLSILGLATPVTGTGYSFQWQRSSDNINFTNINNALAATYIATATTTNNYFRCGIACASGGIVYSNSINLQGPVQLNGTYTINNNGGADYQSFTEAVADLSCKGVSGPVTFNVAMGSGPYAEQITINKISGASSINTVKFNGNGATLAFGGITSSVSRVGITLNGANYVTINSLLIDGSTGTYGWGVLFTNAADYNTISGCTITVNSTSTTINNNYGIVMSASNTSASSSGNNGNNNTIINNTIIGGYIGMYICGDPSSTTQNINNKIVNNTINDFYFTGIYAQNLPSGFVISKNNFSRPMRTNTSTTTCSAIEIYTGCVGILVEKNRIHNMFDAMSSSTAPFYGIYLASKGKPGQENKLISNLIYNMNGNGSVYGIYNSIGDTMQAYHNTIVLDDVNTTTGGAYGYYQSGQVYGVDFRNNIIYITRSGTGTKRCIDIILTGTTLVSNKNILYLNSAAGTNNKLGQWGTPTYTDLAAWQTANANAYDQNSISVDPLFTGTANGNYIPSDVTCDNIGDNLSVTTDILDSTRGTPSDAGAFEFGIILPVHLLNFSGEKNGTINMLKWATLNELNNTGFELQRSSNSKEFSKISFIDTKAINGTSNAVLQYNFEDHNPLSGANYYRLNQIDKNGKATVSNVVAITNKNSNFDIINLYPNPAAEKINIKLIATKDEFVKIVVTDIAGSILLQENKFVIKGENNIALNIQSFAAGTYTIKAVCNSGNESTVIKFTKKQ